MEMGDIDDTLSSQTFYRKNSIYIYLYLHLRQSYSSSILIIATHFKFLMKCNILVMHNIKKFICTFLIE